VFGEVKKYNLHQKGKYHLTNRNVPSLNKGRGERGGEKKSHQNSLRGKTKDSLSD